MRIYWIVLVALTPWQANYEALLALVAGRDSHARDLIESRAIAIEPCDLVGVEVAVAGRLLQSTPSAPDRPGLVLVDGELRACRGGLERAAGGVVAHADILGHLD